MFKRSDANVPYVVPAVRDGNKLIWTVSATDTSVKGCGRAEIRWNTEGGLAKTLIYITVTAASLSTNKIQPAGFKSWFDKMVEYIDSKTIESVELNDDTSVSFNFSNETSVTTPPLKGEKGETGPQGTKGDKGDTGAAGNGIQRIRFNRDYTLTIEFTDGSLYMTPVLKGETGNGIRSVHSNSDYTLTIEFTDGTYFVTRPLKGDKGDKGDRGDKGAKGDKGDRGPQGVKGDTGLSAYDQARQGGYTGTEAQFRTLLASLENLEDDERKIAIQVLNSILEAVDDDEG